jgi:hypothetical protein
LVRCSFVILLLTIICMQSGGDSALSVTRIIRATDLIRCYATMGMLDTWRQHPVHDTLNKSACTLYQLPLFGANSSHRAMRKPLRRSLFSSLAADKLRLRESTAGGYLSERKCSKFSLSPSIPYHQDLF